MKLISISWKIFKFCLFLVNINNFHLCNSGIVFNVSQKPKEVIMVESYSKIRVKCIPFVFSSASHLFQRTHSLSYAIQGRNVCRISIDLFARFILLIKIKSINFVLYDLRQSVIHEKKTTRTLPNAIKLLQVIEQ